MPGLYVFSHVPAVCQKCVVEEQASEDRGLLTDAVLRAEDKWRTALQEIGWRCQAGPSASSKVSAAGVRRRSSEGDADIAEPDCPLDCLYRRFSRYFTPFGSGQKLATGQSMNARKVLDGQPGATPVIRTDGKNVTFRFELVGLLDQLRLALRCDPNGNVWAALVGETERTEVQ